MTLIFTSDTLRAAYNYLNETPPFDKWNLPDGDDVDFVVTKHKTDMGWHKIENGKDIIGASSACIGRSSSLIELVAHEMVHLHQRSIGTETPGVSHNRAFNMMAVCVCKHHGFDPKLF